MPPSWPADVLRLVRARNLVLAAAGVAVGGVLVLGRPTIPALVAWAMVSAVGLGAAGNIANDLADRDADRINRPERPLVRGAISASAAIVLGGVAGGLGLLTAWWAGRTTFAIGVAALVVMLLYSPVLKARGLAGNVAVAVIASLPFVYGPAALGDWRVGRVPFAIAALLHFAREVVKDLEDVAGDRAMGRRTLPIVRGETAAFLAAALALIAFVPVSLAPLFAGLYGRRYGIVVALLDVALLVLVVRLLHQRLAGARGGLKVAMVAGLAALLWDRL